MGRGKWESGGGKKKQQLGRFQGKTVILLYVIFYFITLFCLTIFRLAWHIVHIYTEQSRVQWCCALETL